VNAREIQQLGYWLSINQPVFPTFRHEEIKIDLIGLAFMNICWQMFLLRMAGKITCTFDLWPGKNNCIASTFLKFMDV